MTFVNNQHQEAGIPISKSKDLPIASYLETKHHDGSPPVDYRLDLKSNQDMMKVLSDSTHNANWYELRFPVLGPDRRGYHSTFVHNKRVFIFGKRNQT